MECVSSGNQHRVDEGQSEFVRFNLWKHINPILLRIASDKLRFRKQNSSNIELHSIQRQHSEGKSQFIWDHLAD